MMKIAFKIFKTNWINILSVFLAVYLFTIASEMSHQQESFGTSLSIALFGGLFGIVFYGAIFWIGLLLLLFLFDLILIKNAQSLTAKLILEWFIVCVPFIYWFFEYTEWIFLVGCVALLISQMIRQPRILDILKKT